jgi:hypothetical protein
MVALLRITGHGSVGELFAETDAFNRRLLVQCLQQDQERYNNMI